MSVKHVFLALIAQQPIHGYELKKRFDSNLGTLWPLQQAQVYNNLNLLESAGHIELDERIEQEKLPARKHFRITATGREELEKWLRTPMKSKRLLKDDFYLKVTTLAQLLERPEALQSLLWDQRAIYLQNLRSLEGALITRHWLREHRPRLRVLAADDSASNRLIITQMLELQEHEVVTVSDGREALDTYEAGLFDAILLDMEMPNMTGIEAAAALRDAGVAVPIIALTGHSSPEQIQKCLDAGMTDHLGKPFEFSELIDTIESVVKGA